MMLIEESAGQMQEPSIVSRPKKRLAIISTSNELCGIAAYTKYLVPQLEDDFIITVFDLDQYLLRGTHKNLRKAGDQHIKEICAQLPSFDFVNIQLEHGTLGTFHQDITRRYRWLVQASPALSVTFHTVPGVHPFSFDGWLSEVLSFKWIGATDRVLRSIRQRALTKHTAGFLAKQQREKPLNVIVHTRRDALFLRHVVGIKTVYDHPLAFISRETATQKRATLSRSKYSAFRHLPEDAVVIGVFGFLSPYKGFEVAIRAMHRLPPNYHLMIFGGVHPNDIAPEQPISLYVKSLIDETHAGFTRGDSMLASDPMRTFRRAPHISQRTSVVLNFSNDMALKSERDLSDRVHFQGALNDDDFVDSMILCDTVVMPYVEVGQSSSGPLSQAVEMGCRVIASRTRAFLQFDRYQPGMIEFFDVGNHVELAARILGEPIKELGVGELTYNTATNRAVYLAANTTDEERVAQADAAHVAMAAKNLVR